MESWTDRPVEARSLPARRAPRAWDLRVWSLLRGTAATDLLTLTVGILLSAGCAVQDRSVPAGAHLGILPEEELRVVDCLLPSQVRHLGSQLIYLSPRQSIKTSARDCEIRGGSQEGPSAKPSGTLNQRDPNDITQVD